MGKPTGEQIVFGVLSYLGILVLIPFLIKKDDDFVHFHAKQGLIMLIVWIAIAIISMVPYLGLLFGSVLYVILGIVSLIAIIKVFMGEKWEIPIISTYADKLNI